MATRDALDALVDLIHDPGEAGTWAKRSREALVALFTGDDARYPSSGLRQGEGDHDGPDDDEMPTNAVTVRAPDMRDAKGSNGEVTRPVRFAALIDPRNPTSGAYGGASFVVFPVWNEGGPLPCVFGLVVGTQGLAPDEDILGRPGHARKARALARWLGSDGGSGFCWAKADPTRTDQQTPAAVREQLKDHASVLERYGNVIYLLYAPGPDRARVRDGLAAMLDIYLSERGVYPRASFRKDAAAIERQWMERLFPAVGADQLLNLLNLRRYVILEGPPGTGKTHLAEEVRDAHYGDRCTTIQFHANTTYEAFVGGLGPVVHGGRVGLAFEPKPGHLMSAIARAHADESHSHLLLIDEINRADLAKVLGEAIILFEPDAPSPRTVRLAHDFAGFGQTITMPRNLHVLGTMNTADRSIAVVDVAVRRRFAFLQMWPQWTVVDRLGSALTKDAYRRVLSAFMEHAPDEAFDLIPGHSYYMSADDATAARRLNVTLAPLLREYLAQGHLAALSTEVEAILQWLESTEAAT